MVNIEKNKQFQETEERIEKIFRHLRQTLPIEKISVSRICQEANINRSSFYYHYLDVYDLNDKLIEKINARLSQKMTEIGKDFLSRSNLIVFFKHLQDEKEIYRILTDVKVHFPIQRSYDSFKDFLLTKERYQQQSSEELELSIIYIQAGFHYMVRQWLTQDCPIPADQMVDLFLNELN